MFALQTVSTRELSIAQKIAAHPVMIKLRAQQDAARRMMVRDYGDDFMMTHREMPNMSLPNGRKSLRSEGVHYWTPAQRKAYNALENRMRAVRSALRNVYAAA